MKLSWMRKARYFAASAAVVSLIGMVTACGGGGGTYEAPSSGSSTPSWWANYDQPAETLISADTLAGWINNGFKASDGSKVLVLDVQTDFTGTANRIVGSTSTASIEAFTVSDNRAEGPIDTIGSTNSNLATAAVMVPKGATMDAMLQDMGVTKDTVIVLTSAQSGNGVWNLTRGWWMLYYWGFSETKIKVLDGGVAAMASAYPSLVDTATASVDPTDSTFTVKSLPGLHADSRMSTKELIDAVKAGTVKVIDVRGSAGQGAVAFSGRIKGAITGITGASVVNSDGTFISEADGETLLSAAGVTSSDKLVVHCVSGKSATPVYYFLKAVMGYDVALYDGSYSAWSAHAGYEPGASYASEALYWSATTFMNAATSAAVGSSIITLGGPLQSDVNSNILAYDTLRLSTNTTTPQTVTLSATTNWRDTYGVLLFTSNPDYTGTGNEIEEADAAYVASDDEGTDSDTGSDDESTSGGGDASGC